MNCVVIRGTDYKGATNKIADIFVENFTGEVVEHSLPSQGPKYCTRCKNCFNIGEAYCPHNEEVDKIWSAIKNSDIVVFIYPTYVLRAPGHVKSLLDHFAVHFMAHRPEPSMKNKRGVVITQSLSPVNGPARKDVVNSMNWWGISKVSSVSVGLLEGIVWKELTESRRKKIEYKIKNLAQKISKAPLPKRRSLKVYTYFKMCQLLQKSLYKKLGAEEKPSLDLQHWIDLGWIK